MSAGMGGNPANQPRQPDRRTPKDLGIQWVPKFAGDKGMTARDPRLPMPQPPAMDIREGARISDEWEYDTSTSRPRQYVYVTQPNRVYKVDPETDRIIWSRWSV